MRCPACSCETEESRGFCDLCGEPFAKKKEGPVVTPAPPAPAQEPPVKVPPEVMAKLLDAGSRPEAPKGPVDIPEEFRHLDAGGAVPEFPPQARKLAWAMLAVVMAWIVGAIVWMFMNQDKIATGLK